LFGYSLQNSLTITANQRGWVQSYDILYQNLRKVHSVHWLLIGSAVKQRQAVQHEFIVRASIYKMM
jgi:hypothetical protein